MNFSYTVAPAGQSTRDSGDPLGLRAVATRIARDLVPGLTQTTTMTSGYSLLCLGLQVAHSLNSVGRAISADDAFLRFETWWVLAQVGAGCDTRLPGTRRARQVLEAMVRSGSVDLDVSRLLRHQLSTGLWGSYRRSAEHFGLILRHGGGRGTKPTVFRLAGPGCGDDLAAAARMAITGGGAVQLAARLREGVVDTERISGICVGDAPTARELKILTACIQAVDKTAGSPLRNLHRSYERAGNHLSLSTPHMAELTPLQRRALRAARELRSILTEIEPDFRAYITEGAKIEVTKKWLRDRDLSLFNEWDLLADMERLRRHCLDLGVTRGIREHHAAVCERRGSTPWERGDTDDVKRPEAFDEPRFALPSAKALFDEGVSP